MPRALVVVLLFLGSGCATVFKGTRRDVTFVSEPRSTAVVIGGAVGSVLAKVHDLDEARGVILGFISPVLPPDTRQFLEALTADQLLTVLFAILRPTEQTNDTVDELGGLYAQVPPPVRSLISKTIFVEGGGYTPLAINLKKGDEYAGIAWAPGRRAHLLIVDTHFDLVTLLNVFTLGVGFIVDAITGAWFDLEPSVSWQLAPQVTPVTPPAR